MTSLAFADLKGLRLGPHGCVGGTIPEELVVAIEPLNLWLTGWYNFSDCVPETGFGE